MARYRLEDLRKHSQSILSDFQKSLSSNPDLAKNAESAFEEFSAYVNALESGPATLTKNVRLLLACKLLNHVYSGLILAEKGLIVDAVACERNAIETILFHWLIFKDPSAVHKYESRQDIQPKDVRRKLQHFGVNIVSGFSGHRAQYSRVPVSGFQPGFNPRRTVSGET